ncbi:MAG TPA: DUF1499 domain-containing protein [Nitrospira sp.]|nr:DUF1499 domain-containing protein [Nitrospira sp.]
MQRCWLQSIVPEAYSAHSMSLRTLPPCPSSPNCVSTHAADQGHAIEPIRYRKARAEAKEALKQAIRSLPRVALVEEDESYLHYEFTSLLFRFVDDVEFVFDDATKTLHFRSASRTGYGDLGVNRKRMEEIRRLVGGTL